MSKIKFYLIDYLGKYILSLATIKRRRTVNWPATYLTNELVTGENEPKVNASLDNTIPNA